MPQFFFNKKLILLLTGIIILVALIGFSLREREELSWPERFLTDTTGWFLDVVDKPVSGVTGFFENMSDLKNTYNENKELKARLDEYAQLKTEVQEVKKQNTELRDLLGKKDDLSEYTPIQATVIGRNPDRWHELIKINKGEGDGVEVNDAVRTADGLIGKVKNTTKFTATIQLLTSTDAANKVSARIVGKDTAYGVLEGYDESEGMLLLKRIPNNKEVKKGATVITSGWGNVFPSMQIIGKVVEVKVDQNGMTQTAYVEPASDFYDIQNVMVLKRTVASNEDDLDLGTEEEDK